MNLALLQASIIAHEGTGPVVNGRFMPYRDSRGLESIGYGRCLDKIGISQLEASFLLGNDIQAAITEAQAQDWWPKVADSDARSRAFVELLYNLGLAGLNSFRHALFCLRAGDYAGTADNLMDSDWARTVGPRAVALTEAIRQG